MPPPLRNFSGHDVWFITNRCLQARNLMLPHVPMVREVTGGVLARATELHPVRLFAYAFLSNHFHLMIGAHGQVIADFMRHLSGNLARKLGLLTKGKWLGRFWERRYSAAPVLDEIAAERALRYVVSHGVKEGLVSTPTEWEGLHCASQLLDELPREYKWFDWSKRWKSRTTGEQSGISRWDPSFSQTVTLRLSPLPSWENQSPDTRREKVRQMLAEIEREHAGRSVLGMRAIREEGIDPSLTRKRGDRPLCHATGEDAEQAFRSENDAFVRDYRQASARWRSGCTDAEFPAGAFKPIVRDGGD